MILYVLIYFIFFFFFFFFQAEDGIRDHCVTGVQTCALPILRIERVEGAARGAAGGGKRGAADGEDLIEQRSEEHTSELQSHSDLVCRLLLEKKNLTFSHTVFLAGMPEANHKSTRIDMNLRLI